MDSNHHVATTMDRGDESIMDLMMISLEHIREQFPSLQTCSDVLLDNAGGSQVPRLVADAIRDYMLSNYVQVGADYRLGADIWKTVSGRKYQTSERVAGETWADAIREDTQVHDETMNTQRAYLDKQIMDKQAEIREAQLPGTTLGQRN